MNPPVVSDVLSLREAIAQVRRDGKTIGLVPTMGALHRGHTSLMELARRETGFVVVSIFVNPTQFGPNEDFQRYPRSLETDREQCEAVGVDLVFAPPVEVIYPPGFQTFVEVADVSRGLCGTSRPTHFRGVATVVAKLFNLVAPDRAYFGQKDAQQVRIIQQLVRDLDMQVAIAIGPTVREPDGLALSSRNQYLDSVQRRHATILYRALQAARGQVESGERDGAAVRRQLMEMIRSAPGAVLDYAEVVSWETLQPLERLRGTVLLAVAVKFGATRLIDNVLIDVPSPSEPEV